MVKSLTKLSGRLGEPNLTLASDPRLVADFPKMGLDGFEEAPPLTPDAPYDEIVEYMNELEAGMAPLYVEMFGSLLPVEGVVRRTETIQGVDGNEIRLYIHEPTEREGPLPGILHTHGGRMAVCAGSDPQYVRWRDELAATGLVVVAPEFRNAGGKLGPIPSRRA